MRQHDDGKGGGGAQSAARWLLLSKARFKNIMKDITVYCHFISEGFVTHYIYIFWNFKLFVWFVDTLYFDRSYPEKFWLINTYILFYKGLVTRLEADLDTERERVQQQRHREEELRSQVMTFELSQANKQGEIERLERMLEVVKQECSSQVLDKVRGN